MEVKVFEFKKKAVNKRPSRMLFLDSFRKIFDDGNLHGATELRTAIKSLLFKEENPVLHAEHSSPFFYRLKRRLHRILLEESDDPQAPAEFRSKPRPQLHNAFLTESWAASTGIVSIALIPVIVWLIAVPYFVIGYLVWCMVTGVLWSIARFKVKKLNEQDYLKTARTAADVISENA